MIKKTTIKKLAEASYLKNDLAEDKVMKIAKSLKREDLKAYIKNIKTMEAKKSIIITIPNDKGLNEIKNYFIKLYPNKKLIFNMDESLLSGVRVVDYDNVYELSLQNFLETSIRGAAND